VKKIRILHIEFEAFIEPWELPAFRSAVIEVTGRKHVLFHQHMGDTFLYKYPLIQYKRIGRRPALLCFEQGVDELHHFFENKGEVILLGNRELTLDVAKLYLNHYTLQVWNNPFHYEIRNWVALNEENFKKYTELQNPEDQIKLLEDTLTGNILAFAKGIEWMVDKTIELKIDKLHEAKPIKIKNARMMIFNCGFRCNVSLPPNLGLGKAVSKGFGITNRVFEKAI